MLSLFCFCSLVHSLLYTSFHFLYEQPMQCLSLSPFYSDFPCTCTYTRWTEWHEVTENVCGNPTFYIEGDKSLCKWKIEKIHSRWGKIVYPKCKSNNMQLIGHDENSLHVCIFCGNSNHIRRSTTIKSKLLNEKSYNLHRLTKNTNI